MKKRNLWKQTWKDNTVAEYRAALAEAVESPDHLSFNRPRSESVCATAQKPKYG